MIKELIEKRVVNFNLLTACAEQVEDAYNMILEAILNNNKILFCGNGGSASDSNHLACEFISRFKKERQSIEAISLSANNSIITAIANDYSFDDIFKRQIEGIGKEGDVLIAISTSGTSRNIAEAIKQAIFQRIKVILLTGKNKTNYNIDLEINVPSVFTEEIQEMHIALGHIICEMIEKNFS